MFELINFLYEKGVFIIYVVVVVRFYFDSLGVSLLLACWWCGVVCVFRGYRDGKWMYLCINDFECVCVCVHNMLYVCTYFALL